MLNLKHGIYLIIFLTPIYLWKFSILRIPLNFLELLVYLLFLFWFFNKTRKNNFYNFNSVFKNNLILFMGISFLFLGLIISTSLSSELRVSLGILKSWFVNPFLFFVVFIDIMKKKEDLIMSLKSWLVSGFVVSLIGICYLLSGKITFDGRLQVFFLSPNYLAMFLAPVFLIILSFILNERKEKNWFFLVFLIIILIPLYATYSYGAFLGIFAGVIYLIFKQKRLKVKNIYFFCLFIFLFLGLIFLSLDKFKQIVNSENRSSFHSRLMIWNVTEEIIKNNLFLGIGSGTFQKEYLAFADNFSEPYLQWAVPHPHNVFLAFYLQTGFIGFIGFCLILIWFFSRRSKKVFYFDDLVNALMISTLIHGFVDTTYWKNDLALMFWLMIGIKFVVVCTFKEITQHPSL